MKQRGDMTPNCYIDNIKDAKNVQYMTEIEEKRQTLILWKDAVSNKLAPATILHDYDGFYEYR